MSAVDLDLEEACRVHRPVKVVAVLDDDREVQLAVPRGSRRWERLATVAASQSWCEVRLLDARGALLACVTRQPAERPTEPARLEPGPASSEGANLANLARLVMEYSTRSFVEVAKVMRSAGSTEVTAALAANRETSAALQLVIETQRGQIAELQGKVAELEAELGRRLADDVDQAREEARRARAEREAEGDGGVGSLVKHFLGGAEAAARDKPAKPAT